MDKNVNLLVATPCGRGQVEVGYMCSCLGLQNDFSKRQWRLSFSFISGALVHRLRNELVSRFLNNLEYTHILFIDSDIQFDAGVVARMLALNKNVVGGVCPYKKYDRGQLSYNTMEKGGEARQPDGALEVKRIGTGFLLIKREVFSQIEPYTTKVTYKSSAEESGNKSINHVSTWDFFDFLKDENGVEQGEDFSFCRKLEQAGIKIWVLPDEKFIHWGLHGYGTEIMS